MVNLRGDTAAHRPTVLFICVHNAGRSQMAEAFATDIVKRRALWIRFRSAGTEPRKEVNPAVITAMEEAGVLMTGRFPHQLTQGLVDQSDRVITMGCGLSETTCPVSLRVSEDWPVEDPADQPIEKVRQIRDDIRQRVDALVEEMTGDPQAVAGKEENR